MTDSPNKIIPNSFQAPNFFVDECMPYLTGNEIMCVIFLARKTFGWQKRSDRISKSQIVQATGLNAETIDSCMEALVKSGVVLRVKENNARNEGVEWALQLDDQKIRFDWLKQRKTDRELKQQERTKKAREVRANQGVGLLDNPTPQELSVGQKTQGGGVVEQTEGGVVGQPPQKPIKPKKEHREQGAPGTSLGADAPGRAFATIPENRIGDFPEDCREGARLMWEVFNVKPPKRPARDAKGGDFALWINGIRELKEIAAEYNTPLPRAMQLTFSNWNQATFRVSHPGALKKAMKSALATASLSRSKTSGDPDQPPESPLENFRPRGSK